jgi:hypothetical protein
MQVDRAALYRIEASHFIKPEAVINVIVREQDRVAALQVCTNRLNAKVRPCVEQYDTRLAFCVFKLQHSAGAKALVSRVAARAHIARAPDHRNARRSACAQKRKTHA